MKSTRRATTPQGSGAPAIEPISRRLALQRLGAGLLAGCSDGATEDAPTGTAGEPDGSRWATGGTSALRDAETFPDPFDDPASASCALTCALTLGPCWAPSAPVRQDVSEGQPGIPMRLALRVVQADACTPVAGAEVEIWYCNLEGAYSASDVEGGNFCTGGNEEALAGYFFRGRAIADGDGKLAFHGCYPGWYPGRAIHIHLLIRPPERVGEATSSGAMAISQLFFPEELTEEVFAAAPGYVDKGQPDTRLSSDNVLRGVDDPTPFVVDYERLNDGTMLAWKTIALSEAEQCTG